MTRNNIIQMQFSAEEAVTLLRAIGAAKQKAAGTEVCDDLELLRYRIHQQLQKPSGRIYSSEGRIHVWNDAQRVAA